MGDIKLTYSLVLSPLHIRKMWYPTRAIGYIAARQPNINMAKGTLRSLIAVL